jgi:hypothetical protein
MIVPFFDCFPGASVSSSSSSWNLFPDDACRTFFVHVFPTLFFFACFAGFIALWVVALDAKPHCVTAVQLDCLVSLRRSRSVELSVFPSKNTGMSNRQGQ